MNRKAFTLAEMLGVITILAILGLLIFPVVDKSLKEGKEDLYNVQISNIEQSAKEWVSDNVFIAPESDGEWMLISLYQLKQSSKLDKNITNPVTKKLFPNDMAVKITKVSNDYKTELLRDTGSPVDLTKYSDYTPNLKLNGDEVIYLEYKNNSTEIYTDAGVTALSNEGESLQSSVTTATFDGEGNVILGISYGQPGIYNIYYDVEDHDITARVIRTIIVKPPVITVPATQTISKTQAASYNLISTVTVTDESTYTISTDRTTLPSVEGTYTITYTATDSYGNTSTARRTIIVE